MFLDILYTLSKRKLPQLGKNVCVPSKCNKAGGQTDKNHKNTLFLGQENLQNGQAPAFGVPAQESIFFGK